MKFSSQEEYGLRLLLRIAHDKSGQGLTIPEISEAEKLSQANAAKILRILRMGGFVESERGMNGGYKLTQSPDKIIVGDVLAALGGKLFKSSFCTDYSGVETICTHTIDCSIRSLWRAVQVSVDNVLNRISLRDLMHNEEKVNLFVNSIMDEAG
jgi:Rrf2 family protein